MDEFPGQLLDGLSSADRTMVAAWWAELPDATRSQVADLYDPSRDNCFFGVAPGDTATHLPKVIGGRFIPRDEAACWAEWHAELFDYLVCNPELVFVTPPVVRTFHICTHHKAAHAVLEARRIGSDFECPLGLKRCPMRHLLSAATARRGS
jgi:hypothetical protein